MQKSFDMDHASRMVSNLRKTLAVDVFSHHGTKEMKASVSDWFILLKSKKCTASAAGFSLASVINASRVTGVKQESKISKRELRRLGDMKIANFIASAWHNGNHLSIDFSVD